MPRPVPKLGLLIMRELYNFLFLKVFDIGQVCSLMRKGSCFDFVQKK